MSKPLIAWYFAFMTRALVRRKDPELAAVESMWTTDEKWALGVAVCGGVALIAGAIYLIRSRSSTLGQIEDEVLVGGMKLVHHYDAKMPIQKRLKLLQGLTFRSIKDPRSRKLALGLTSNCPERDGMCEAEAVYNAIKGHVRYTGDVAPVKHDNGVVEGVDLFQSAYRTWEFGGGDCLPAGTLLLNDRFEFVPIEKAVIGTRIWGRDAWTTIKDVWFKGVLPVDAVFLNNGSSFKATEDHKVYVMRHDEVCRVTLAEIEPGALLVSPKQVANPLWPNRIATFPTVKAIERGVMDLPVYDLSTEDHYVYLPEADVTVSNCDDHSILAATLLSLNGIPARFRVTAPRAEGEFSHIYVVAGLPKTKPTRWVVLDTTLPGYRFGTEAPHGRQADFPV